MMQPIESNPNSISGGGKCKYLPNKSNLQDLWGHLSESLDQRKEQGLFRAVRPIRHIDPTHFELDGRRIVHFGSNDYLGLSCHPEVVRAQNQGSNSRFGSGASQLICGFSTAHQQLVAEIANFEREDAAIVFSSGFAANVGTVASLASSEDVVFSDSLNHASLIDGCRMSRAQIHVFAHCQIDHLRELVAEHRHRGRFAFIVTDSVFSMDGDLAPMLGIHQLCEQYDMHCILDEAHATGVLGDSGRGLVEQLGIDSNRFIRVGTLSKAVGCIGGFVAGKQVLIDWLTNFARPGIYSTALPIPSVLAAARSLQLIPEMKQERMQLQSISIHLRQRLSELGLRVGPSESPIIPIYFEGPDDVVQVSGKLLGKGLYVPAIRPPTVPKDRCMLRISLSSVHTREDIEQLVDALSGI